MDSSTVTSAVSRYSSSTLVDRIGAATQKPLERLNRNVESTKVQLSAFGQVKSATAQVESVAKNLQSSDKLSTIDEVKKAVQNFVGAVNNQRTIVAQVSGSAKDSNNATVGALAGDSRARSVTNDVRRAVQGTGGSNESALKQIGISVAQDGSLKVDTKKLEAAYAADPNAVTGALKQIGNNVEEVANRQLSNSGNLGGSINRLNERLGNYQQTQANYQAGLKASQQAVDQRNFQIDQAQTQTQQAFGLIGANAYKGVFSI